MLQVLSRGLNLQSLFEWLFFQAYEMKMLGNSYYFPGALLLILV